MGTLDRDKSAAAANSRRSSLSSDDDDDDDYFFKLTLPSVQLSPDPLSSSAAPCTPVPTDERLRGFASPHRSNIFCASVSTVQPLLFKTSS